MILLTDRTESTKIPYSELIEYSPLVPLTNPCKWAYWNMRKQVSKENREFIEVSSWDDPESMHKVMAVKSRGLEKWE